jgi:hypothetical protein
MQLLLDRSPRQIFILKGKNHVIRTGGAVADAPGLVNWPAYLDFSKPGLVTSVFFVEYMHFASPSEISRPIRNGRGRRVGVLSCSRWKTPKTVIAFGEFRTGKILYVEIL